MEQIMWKRFDQRLAEFLLQESMSGGDEPPAHHPRENCKSHGHRPGGCHTNAPLFSKRGYGKAVSWRGGDHRCSKTAATAKPMKTAHHIRRDGQFLR